MKLKIAGGCGEHGRNCFLVENGDSSFMVDCGLMAGADEPYPRLEPQEIKKTEYVFLTHSHADHTGALPWLYDNGFCGRVIAAEYTLQQLPFAVKDAVPLEKICSDNRGRFGETDIEYGRSGHCAGSVWYHFHTDGSSILFSGDYTEHSAVYCCDPIRGRKADIAVLDCAYGSDSRSFSQCCDELTEAVKRLKQAYKTLFFPVPKYGRGIELLKIFNECFPDFICCGDEHFLGQLSSIPLHKKWFKCIAPSALPFEPDKNFDIAFISDPQLRSEKAQKLAAEIIGSGGFGIMTGTVERGSFSEELISSEKMITARYPVHQNYSDYLRLVNSNDFSRSIPYHTAEMI